MTFEENWNWQLRYLDDIKNILKEQLINFVKIEIANPKEDMEQATDLKIEVTGGNVGVRIRRDTSFRDFTIRAYKNGNRTEIDKLREGYCNWYLYCWTRNDKITDWILLDINKMREKGLLDTTRNIKMNTDGKTGFYIYALEELEDIIIASKLG